MLGDRHCAEQQSQSARRHSDRAARAADRHRALGQATWQEGHGVQLCPAQPCARYVPLKPNTTRIVRSRMSISSTIDWCLM